ncbi:MAG TPA: redoxin family protein [Armatimonadaceae bacterium]|nr:redoxin family protein [Armatimonadaceae bacterium]
MKIHVPAAVAAFGALLLISGPPSAAAQEKPTVVKENLPKKAVCFVCSQNGEEHGEEKPAGAVAYKGKTYYFCNKKEVEAFLKDPEAVIPAPLPRPVPTGASFTDLGGKAVSADTLKRGTVVVDFWATWCGPCVKAMPEIQKMHDRYGARGLRVVGVSIDEEGAKVVAPFLAKRKFTYPMLLDGGGAWETWGVKALPTVLLVRDGRIVAQWTGKVDVREVEKAAVAALTAQTPGAR